MPIRVALHHKTEYCYDRQVSLQPHIVRLRPAPHCRTPILSYSLTVEPEGHFLNWQQDPYSNYLARLVFPELATNFSVEVDLVAELTAINPFDFFIEAASEKYPFTYDPILARELAPYLETPPAGPELQKLVDAHRRRECRTIDFLVGINCDLQQKIGYLIRLEPGVQTCEETLTNRSGSCRDSAWLMVQLLRQLGLAARFVSGYLIQLVSDVEALDGPSGPKQDFSDLHAWAEVYVQGAGWIGLDPTSGLLAGEGHIPLACAADPITAAPITGSYLFTPSAAKGSEDVCHEEFKFRMSVTRIHETPRVTKPYTEETWAAIDALGERVDRRLSALDVRLTMGGEPTFVSIDNRDAPEWNTAALGDEKHRQAAELLKRLQTKFSPGALLHMGQGKWYPGEPLPRWAFGCYWRRDGVPLWDDHTLLADLDIDYGHSVDDAKLFITTLADRLGVEAAHCLPGYEDVWFYLWRERRLPTNVDPLESKLEDEQERLRLAQDLRTGLKRDRRFRAPDPTAVERRRDGLGKRPVVPPAGTHVPVSRRFADGIPAPARYASLGTSRAARRSFRSRSARTAETAANACRAGAAEAIPNLPHGTRPESGVSLRRRDTAFSERPRRRIRRPRAHRPVRRAAGGAVARLHASDRRPRRLSRVDFGDRSHVGRTPVAGRHRRLQAPLRPSALEFPDHPRPGRDRSQHPARPDVARNGRHHDDALRRSAADSPQHRKIHARRPALRDRRGQSRRHRRTDAGGQPGLAPARFLRSLVSCWHNHPALSYLFSSLFIGPTSQAPRVDEARNDSLYEMEIAFQQIPEHGGCPPWLVDRVFRHLLVDVTGNTHRAEFCIDKLYNPDSSEGRRGLVELRAFEMPPHSRMSLVQQLLLRAMVARFWETPYSQKLVRWGTELHDRFMLPHFVEHDLDDLLFEMNQAGYALQKEWFAPHLEFRFPLVGTVTHSGVQIELRQAIEPWHVLGEESGPGGTARYVDSSVERIQVKVQGLTDPRHVLTCNGERVPLFPTGTNGEFVAGVRYRAWQPPSCLHPTIGIHTPLLFDLYDTWTSRSVGACQYHVKHQGGLSYETLPVNAAEAETRRHSRFYSFGHTPQTWNIPPAVTSAEAPLTLDLRRPAPAVSAPAVPTAPVGTVASSNGQHLSSAAPRSSIIESGADAAHEAQPV